MSKVLKKESLRDWVAQLASHRVYAPAFADDVWGFRPVADPAEVALDHTNTARPPKNFTFPQREVLYTFSQEKGGAPVVTATVPDPAPTVVFGVRPCDGRATPRNDKVFTTDFQDPYYTARREKVAYVGLACNAPPSPNCFCQAVGGSPTSEDGLDILLTDLGGRYHVKVLTAKGEQLVDAAGGLFTTANSADEAEVGLMHAEAQKHPQRSVGEQGKVVEGLRANFDSPLWQEMARACIGCGVCTFLCPTCHCFDINDEVTCKTPCKGERVRTWDNCQFPDFTMHASGHNPRETLGSRLRQRVSHKFLYFVENNGMQQCTGCGRCSTHCPVGIDIVAVVNKVSQA